MTVGSDIVNDIGAGEPRCWKKGERRGAFKIIWRVVCDGSKNTG